MTRQYLPRFSHPAALREIHPASLLRLVQPYAAYLANHGISLPDSPVEWDIEALGVVLLQPHADTPYELVDTLAHIHEMATPSAMELLIDEAGRAGIELGTDGLHTPADVAVRIWLADPDLLRRKHAEHTVLKRRSFESYLPRKGASLMHPPRDHVRFDRFESEIASWFQQRGRGAGVRVLMFEHEDEVRLVIRHGGPYRREGCLNDGKPGSVHFRPMEFHFVVLNRKMWELLINCKNKGETRLYRELVGLHFLGQRDFFDPESRKFTLEPLQRLGRQSLICSDIPGMQNVRLVELTMLLGGPFGRERVERADDVFLALEDAGETIPRGALPTRAKFDIVFADSRKPRSVIIGGKNRAQYTRDSDAPIVEEFLRRRGFALGGEYAALACA